MKTLKYLLITYMFASSALCDDNTYRAAVVEYAPKPSVSVADDILANAEEYIKFIKEAAEQEVEIIVFPEDGLTGADSLDTLDQDSTEVPAPTDNISPCAKQLPDYATYFVYLSCAAAQYKIYVVVNVVEKRYDETVKKEIYHNTNVVFDRNGVVIARYRKIHLFFESGITPGTELSTFTTDFGVKFGVFTCFDILFKNPSLEVLSDLSVTDVVFPTAWYSFLPFFSSIAVQNAYAKSNGVNLLAAGYDDPFITMGGSGIYSADGKIANAYISGATGSKMIIQDVGLLHSRTPVAGCKSFVQENPETPSPSISAFTTLVLPSFEWTFRTLDLRGETDETVCNGRSFCCRFKISAETTGVWPNYVYKMVVYDGVTTIPLINVGMGVQNCALVACLDSTNLWCGGRSAQPPAGVKFNSVVVEGVFRNVDAHVAPYTMKYNLKSVTDQRFCKFVSRNKVLARIGTERPITDLLIFGLLGRVYDRDQEG